MQRILALFLLASVCMAACGKPIVDESHSKSYDSAEKKAQKEAGEE